MADKIKVLPDAERIMSSLRDTGYTFPASIADIVDNSIAADATTVTIHIGMDMEGAIEISIADNGIGMNRDTLISAMKYGAPRRESRSSLGKFGLGLKTASTSFCKLLQVSTRDKGGVESRASWDLDHIAKVNDWELLVDKPDREAKELLDEAAQGRSGTVVIWKRVDRLLQRDYKSPGGGAARNALERHISELKFQLGLIFQRFIAPSNKWDIQTPVVIILNGKPIEAWDPFCIDISEELAKRTVKVPLDDDEDAEFFIRAYVLPRREDFPSPDVYRQARVSQKYQGIYVYRHNRLIHHGDWLDMLDSHPMKNQLRVELCFGHKLDDAFKVPVDKSYIELDQKIADDLATSFLSAPAKEAERRREQGVRMRKSSGTDDIHSTSNRAISEKEAEVASSHIEVKNPASGEVEVTNKSGEKVRLRMPTVEAKREGEFYIQTSDEVLDGVLYEPVVIEGHQGVRINPNHDYYRKVYLPNRASGVAIQGMDSLIWALCIAELNTCTPATNRISKEIRYEVSRILRSLVEELPNPVTEIDD